MKIKDFFNELFGGGAKRSKSKRTSSKSKRSTKSSERSKSKRASSKGTGAKKTPSKAARSGATSKAKKTDIRKIYKTTDGYFTGNDKIKKTRRVAVVDQRKDDGALAVVKIYSKKEKNGKKFIKGLILSPERHSSLTEESIVGYQVHVGVKTKEQYSPIFKGDFSSTSDKLTEKELRLIKKEAGGEKKKNKKTSRKKIKRWKNHFKQ